MGPTRCSPLLLGFKGSERGSKLGPVASGRQSLVMRPRNLRWGGQSLGMRSRTFRHCGKQWTP